MPSFKLILTSLHVERMVEHSEFLTLPALKTDAELQVQYSFGGIAANTEWSIILVVTVI